MGWFNRARLQLKSGNKSLDETYTVMLSTVERVLVKTNRNST